MKIRSGLTLVALAVLVAASTVAAQPVAPPVPPTAEPAAPPVAAKVVWFTIKNAKTHKDITVYVGDPILVPPALEKGDEVFVAKDAPQVTFTVNGEKVVASDASFSIGANRISVKTGSIAVVNAEGKERRATVGHAIVLPAAVVKSERAESPTGSQQQPLAQQEQSVVSPSAP